MIRPVLATVPPSTVTRRVNTFGLLEAPDCVRSASNAEILVSSRYKLSITRGKSTFRKLSANPWCRSTHWPGRHFCRTRDKEGRVAFRRNSTDGGSGHNPYKANKCTDFVALFLRNFQWNALTTSIRAWEAPDSNK
jgi:hypothetical protein